MLPAISWLQMQWGSGTERSSVSDPVFSREAVIGYSPGLGKKSVIGRAKNSARRGRRFVERVDPRRF
jgi:hypothetical protein